jgi:hypothetical protein
LIDQRFGKAGDEVDHGLRQFVLSGFICKAQLRTSRENGFQCPSSGASRLVRVRFRETWFERPLTFSLTPGFVRCSALRKVAVG